MTKEVRMLTMKLSEYEAASRLATSAASGTSAASAALAGKV